VENRFHLWSETYNRELKSVFGLQDEISKAIANALKVRLQKRGKFQGHESTQPSDINAYEFYLK